MDVVAKPHPAYAPGMWGKELGISSMINHKTYLGHPVTSLRDWVGAFNQCCHSNATQLKRSRELFSYSNLMASKYFYLQTSAIANWIVV